MDIDYVDVIYHVCDARKEYVVSRVCGWYTTSQVLYQGSPAEISEDMAVMA